jgi:hypothetical protein
VEAEYAVAFSLGTRDDIEDGNAERVLSDAGCGVRPRASPRQPTPMLVAFRSSVPAHHQLIKSAEEQSLMRAGCAQQPAEAFFPPQIRLRAGRARRLARRGVQTPNYRAESYGPFKLPIDDQLFSNSEGVSYPCIFFSRI